MSSGWEKGCRRRMSRRGCELGRFNGGVTADNQCRSVSQQLHQVLTFRTNYKIMIPLPPKIDPSVTMMQVGTRTRRR